MKKHLFLIFLYSTSLLSAAPFNFYATEDYLKKRAHFVFDAQKQNLFIMTEPDHFDLNQNYLTKILLTEASTIPELGLAYAPKKEIRKLQQVICDAIIPLLQSLSELQQAGKRQSSQTLNNQAAVTAWLSNTNG